MDMKIDVIKGADGIMRYNPDSKTASFGMIVKFAYVNLTNEQIKLAKKIIYEKEVKNFSDIYLLLDRLAKAGFRGDIISQLQSGLQWSVVINSKAKAI